MPETVTTELLPGVRLRCVRTEKFRTGHLSLLMTADLKRADAAKNALLPRVLALGTAKYPDLESLGARMDDLYGAEISPVNRKFGERQYFGFSASFADDQFVPGGRVLERTAELMGNLLLDPVTRGGMLLPAYVDSEKQKLREEILAERDDKMRWPLKRLTELMCAGERFALSAHGDEKTVSDVGYRGLTLHYRKTIASAPIEITYCGSAAPEELESLMTAALAGLPRGEIASLTETKRLGVKGDVRVFREHMDVAQGKLALGFRMDPGMDGLDYPTASVFNALYGGTAGSKLFRNVREKKSLCYFASSVLNRQKGILYVLSGVDPAKFPEATEEILRQLEAVRRGDFTEAELRSAVLDVVGSVRGALDDPGSMAGLYLELGSLGLRCSPEEYAALADGVTGEQIVKLASSVQEDSEYYLSREEKADAE